MFKIGQEVVCKADYSDISGNHPKLDQVVKIENFEYEGKRCGLFLFGYNEKCFGERLSYPIEDFRALQYDKNANTEILSLFKPTEERQEITNPEPVLVPVDLSDIKFNYRPRSMEEIFKLLNKTFSIHFKNN